MSEVKPASVKQELSRVEICTHFRERLHSLKIETMNIFTFSVAQHIIQVGEHSICTSIIVACELRFGVAKSGVVHKN